ncbi:MAG: NmrA/HSCARG family protein [Actinomycetota bacterium]|nr:NmrA/HSCARG family protein [Actinomycetota bacterium]
MADKKLITVVGATGAQGGSTARALLRDPSFAVRAVTRDPDSDAARALADAGAEVVRADIDDEASLVAALEGAYGAYFVTFFWAHFSPEVEQAQAERMARAAKTAGIQHAIWSTLEDTRRFVPLDDDRMPTLMGEYKVPHFDAKGSANHFFTDAGVPTTFLQTAFYWDNLIVGSGPQRGEDGSLVLMLPMGDAPLSGIAVEDIGKVAAGILAAGDTYIGQTVSIAGEHLTVAEMAAQLSDAIGQSVTYVAIDPEVYRGLGFPGAEDTGNMFQFFRDFSDYFVGERDLTLVRQLNPELLSFREWLAAHADEIPIPPEEG